MNLNQIIAMNIRAYRKFNKLSQNDLAKKLNTSRQHISEIETCKKNVSIMYLEKIANKLEVEPYKLLKNTEVV
ncbi:helix-turn-helix domain-containing protein [Macrococcus capreoli]|uniref:helix-turn-helix domain-containing protein n=1 Tax=Macrococcus capreoli TaxID=2982690 RepID=UPI003F43B668